MQVDAGAKPGASSAELEEIRRLKKELREFRETNSPILKSAVSFFAREFDPRGVRVAARTYRGRKKRAALRGALWAAEDDGMAGT